MATEAELRAAAWLRAWDASGTHRTGTAGDAAGAAWLAQAATALGASVAVEEFALDRIDPIVACLQLGGVRFDGVPVFDAPSTGAGGISGTLGTVGSDAPIAVAELSPHSVYTGEYRAVRDNAAHAGLVIVCQGAQPGLGIAQCGTIPSAVRFAGNPSGKPDARGHHVGCRTRHPAHVWWHTAPAPRHAPATSWRRLPGAIHRVRRSW